MNRGFHQPTGTAELPVDRLPKVKTKTSAGVGIPAFLGTKSNPTIQEWTYNTMHGHLSSLFSVGTQVGVVSTRNLTG